MPKSKPFTIRLSEEVGGWLERAQERYETAECRVRLHYEGGPYQAGAGAISDG
jgi:hypothetical protein